MDPWTFALVVLAAARVTRLVVVDTIAEPARALVLRAAYRRSDGCGDWWASLLGCPFCAGFWVATACTVVAYALPWGEVLLTPWAAAYVASHLSAALD